jgi:hypothetical protein
MPGKGKRSFRAWEKRAAAFVGRRRVKKPTSSGFREWQEHESSLRRGQTTKAPAFRNPRKSKRKFITLRNMVSVTITKQRNGVVLIRGRKA